MNYITRFSAARSGLALALAASVALFGFGLTAQTASAHTSPGGCDTTGVSLSLTVLRADGVTAVGAGSVTPGETIKYRATLSHAGGSNCNYDGGDLDIITPDGANNDVDGGAITLVTSGTPFVGSLVTYVVDSADVGGDGDMDASAVYSGGTSHLGGDVTPVGATAPASTPFVKLDPGITTEVHAPPHVDITSGSVGIGTAVHDKAILTASSTGPTPTGSVAFNLYANSSCTGATTTQVVALAAGVAESSATSTLAVGSHSYLVVYSGDDNYNQATALCEPFTVIKASPSIQTTPSAGGPIGTILNDTATLSGGFSPTGNVTFKLFAPGDTTCGLTPLLTEVDPSSPYGTSPGFTTLVAGTYRWTADYAGDSNNNPVSSGCQDEQVVITQLAPTVTTDIHDAAHGSVTSVIAGSTVHDEATVGGTGPAPTGTVDFTWYTNGSCTPTGAAAGTGIALVSGVAHPSSSQGPLAVGSFSFKAHYNGDANYLAGDSGCEPLTVTKASPSIQTTPSAGGLIGTVLNDTATLSGGFSPTGSVTFKLFAPGDTTCSSLTPLYTEVDPSSPYGTSPGFTTLVAGTYRWTADYAGDSNNNPVSSGCQDEQVVITQPVLGCTLTQGYWKTHNSSFKGGAPADSNWANITPTAELTGFFTTAAANSFPVVGPNAPPFTWFSVFWTPPQGNAYYQLAHQYMAAQLNILSGASAPAAVNTAIATATGLFGTWTPAQIGVLKGNNALRQQFITLAGTLGSYNEGLIGPGHCGQTP